MNVTGYVVRFCTARGCHHESEEKCSNPPSSVYYIDPDQNMVIKDTPLVVTHNQEYIVGKCEVQVDRPEGILLRCVIDDAYFLESLRRRFEDYRGKYNPAIPDFETYCKKTLSSFSLSHCAPTKKVRHVSLVDTPGRTGTAVVYVSDPAIVLIRREKNQHISDIIASHSTAYLTVPDRKSYLLKNTSLSHNPRDLCYINAGRKMNYQDDFNKATEIYNIIKALKGETSGLLAPSGGAIKRTRRTEDDGQDDSEDAMMSCKKRKRTDDCECAAPLPAKKMVSEDMVEAMRDSVRDSVKEGVEAALAMFKEQMSQRQKPAPEDPLESPPVIPEAPAVEASRPKNTTITLTPDQVAQATLDIIINHVTGK